MPSWIVWVQRPSGLIKVEGSRSTFRERYLGLDRECYIGENINNQSKSFTDRTISIGPLSVKG